jgi:hypothetical protein
MNKKLLFGIMSLAALAACSDMNDFESKNIADEAASPVQFEIINDNEATRASMDGNTVVWNANEGDLFTLYHGAAYATPAATTGYQNATYKANANEGGVATLTTPSVILPGSAIMVWPVDTTLRIKAADALTIQIPQVQGGKVNGKEIIQHQIPYVSDVIQIQPYAAYTETTPATAYNTAGKDRKYKIYMRPMASQLNLKADYGTTESQIAALYEGAAGVDAGEGIDPIEVTSVDLLTTAAGNKFTTKIPLQFALPTAGQGTNWGSVTNNAWTQVTNFNVGGILPADQVDKLTTKCLLEENKGCKFLILPQTNIGGTGVTEGAVVVNTTYGKVVVAPSTFATNKGKYSTTEIADAWYRITNTAVPAATAAVYSENAATTPVASGEFAGKFKTTADVMHGMAQVIDAFSANTVTSATSKVKGEPTGAQGTRYVKVLLNYLDMTDLHIKNDKQLRDAARVWKKMNLDDVTVYLDGDANNEFEISQKTIKVINDINASVAGKDFKVQPCAVATEACSKIVITGGDAIQDLAFIKFNDTDDDDIYTLGTDVKADVVLKADENWKWASSTIASKKAFKVDATNTGINSIINKGTLVSDATAKIAIYNNASTPAQVSTIKLVNDGTWDVTSGDLNVQFDVTNNGIVNISAGAEYRQDGTGNDFTNEATTLPKRFIGTATEKIGKVNNSGVFATLNGGNINNYGLIEHLEKNAKTYISANQTGTGFSAAFNDAATMGGVDNKIGRINIQNDNRTEDNISINAAALAGFVSLTVTESGTLTVSGVSNRVNYLIVKGTYTAFSGPVGTIQYVELDQPGTEIEWGNVTTTLDGLMVLSDINIKQTATITVSKSAYLHQDAKMYVGGTCTNNKWNGYYGNTTANFATNYLTY